MKKHYEKIIGFSFCRSHAGSSFHLLQQNGLPLLCQGCHCYVKTDVMHLAPAYEDETSTKEECKAMEAQLNEEAGMDFYKCKQ